MLIPSGTTLDITSATAIIPNTITSLLIWGADESEEKAAIQPDIRLKGLSFADGGGYETIEFYNLYLHHDNNENNFVVYHQNNNATIQNLILESCKVDKIRGIFRFKNATGSCSNCIINNCLIENIGVMVFLPQQRQRERGRSIMSYLLIPQSMNPALIYHKRSIIKNATRPLYLI